MKRRIALHCDEDDEEMYKHDCYRETEMTDLRGQGSAMGSEMESALREGIAKYMGLLSRLGGEVMVTGTIFPFVNARPDVQKALRNTLSEPDAPKWLSFQEPHLIHLRGMLYDYFRVAATRCARSFWCNTDISSETFSSLKAAAQCDVCVKCKSSAD